MIHPKIEKLSDQLVVLEKNKQFDDAETVAKTIVSFFSDNKLDIRPFRSSQFKEKTKNRFFPKPWHWEDLPCTLEIIWANAPIDFKLFWTKKVSKQIIAGITNFSPNFEDSPIHEDCNLWIDIIVPNSTDRVILVLSDKYILRTLELHGKLTATQLEILHKRIQDFDFSNKTLLHQTLWNSFNIKVINNKFYESISRTFVNLVQHLEHQWLDGHESRQFTNRLIGRVVFCWFLKKKNIISEKFDYFNIKEDNSTEYYNKVLSKLFFYTLNAPVEERTHSIRNIWKDIETPYLNWWLFEKRWYDHKDEITFPARFFHDFFEFLNEYNFTTDESTSTYQQVAVDPEMLGRIFENLLAEQNTETGEQARKAKWAFYTPREIVDYMCKEWLKTHLSQKLSEQNTPENDIEKIIDQLFVKSDSEYALNSKGASYDTIQMKYRWNIIGILDNLTVIDPACWSGAFPMWMLQTILRCYERVLPETKFDPAEAKKKIIENSLFGVDIEPMAVEISRLRAWLSIVVDEINEHKVEPLPNLDFKFICANSLIWLNKWKQQMSLWEDEKLKEKLKELRHKYYRARTPKSKNEIKNEYLQLLNQWLFEDSPNTKLLKSFNVFDLNKPAWFFDQDYMFGEDWFDMIIWNPPYVSTKWTWDKIKKELETEFWFADDLYSHFYFKGLEICNPKWVLTYITSKTYWTIQTKKNLRELLLSHNLIEIYDTQNPFESAMVDTCIALVQKDTEQKLPIKFLISNVDKDGNYLEPEKHLVEKSIYEKAVNKVIFKPNKENIEIYDKYNAKVKNLLENYRSMINTSKNITKNQEKLNQIRENLQPWDITLLWIITDWWQGLATANNWRYVWLLSWTKEAQNAKINRKKKYIEFTQKRKINPIDIDTLSEKELRKYFDDLKEQYGRDIFWQGFLYRIINPSEIKDVSKITQEEKENWLTWSQTFVPYDKWDKDGNRRYLRTPYYIDWSIENVAFLKQDPKARYQWYTFYFRAGFCWILTLNEQSEYQKARFREAGVFDVNAMTLFSLNKIISEKYLVCLINSYLVFQYKRNFINWSSAFQINDARQLPIIVPTQEQLLNFENIFDRAYEVKIKQFDWNISQEEANQKLDEIQKELDEKVYKLYGIDM